ncbi:enolase-phosphatase E1-like isoform X1 [Montipora foliosa]|uniref:enolase-phosphatase E1-like isoform X1 n=2 Tax=Montipora foliosa TaxID=591990 RepID=UPI0035F192ED
MNFDQTQAIYDITEEEEDQIEEERAQANKKEMAQLKVFSQQGLKETMFPVFQGSNFIGRDGKCNITIPIKTLSKKHACIEVLTDLHLIRDCESKNKTKKGESFLTPNIRYELSHGDILTLGYVKCQYLVEKIVEEGEEDETGSETRSESMLSEVNTEEEKEYDKVLLAVTKQKATEIPREDIRVEQEAKDCKPSGLSKEEAEAYAGDTDYDTNEEGAPAATTVAPVFYSSDDEQETPARFKTATATLAYGMEATQAYVTGKDDNTDTDNDSKKANMQPNDLQATQVYGIQDSGDNDDEKEERTEKESHKEEIHKHFEVPAARNGIDQGDTIQATTSYNLEAMQPYGGHESDETDDKDAIDKDKGSEEVNKGDKDRTSVTCGLPETLHNGEDKDNTRADHSFLKPPERRKINAKLECGLEETQAYNGGSIDTDPAPSVVIEATQAYGIEEHSDEEMAAAIIPKPSKVGKDRTVEVKETLAPRTRRGKRGRTAFAESASILETPLNKEVETHSLEESMECQLETLEELIPLKGREKGKGRGKKNQATAVKEKMVSEKIAGNEKELHQPVTPCETTGRRRPGRGKRTSSAVTEFEAFEETPAKKSRYGKEPFIFESQSPSLRPEKLAGESNPRVIFTGPVDRQGEKVVTSLGGQLVNDVHSCTHLVTDKVRRTVKFLCGLSRGVIIVQPSWLEACKKAKSFVDASPFLVKDRDAEEQFKFDLQRSHEAACRQGLLEGYKVHVTRKVKPEPSQMKDIIQSAKGKVLSSIPQSIEDNRVFVISCNEDKSVWKKPLEARIPVVSAEILLTGILRQELDFKQHKLFVEETNEATQDHTLSESKMIKRRRESSDAAASSPTVEPKTSAKKRRKR